MSFALFSWLTPFDLFRSPPGAVVGRRFFIDSVAGNNSNTGTSENEPWQTLQPARTYAFQAGDVLLLKSGSVWDSGSMAFAFGGSPGSPLVVRPYGEGAAPHITSSNTSSGFPALLINKASHIRFSGLKFSSASNAVGMIIANQAAVTGITFSGCEIDHSLSANVGGYNGMNLLSNAHDLTDVSFLGCLLIGNAGTSNSDLIKADSVRSGFRAVGNTFLNASGEAIDMGGGINGVIERNLCLNYGGGAFKVFAETGPNTNAVIRNNVGYSNRAKWGLIIQDLDSAMIESNSFVIANNVNAVMALSVDLILQGQSELTDTIIRNNIFAGGSVTSGVARIYNHTMADYRSRVTEENNLYWQYSASTRVIYVTADTGNTATIANFDAGWGAATGSIYAQPGFLNASGLYLGAEDFRPSPGAPQIGAGAIPAALVDYAQQVRVPPHTIGPFRSPPTGEPGAPDPGDDDPTATAAVEYRTTDGAYYQTADGHYYGTTA